MNRDKNIIPTLQGSQKRKPMSKAITDIAPKKMRKMLKNTMVHIFDSHVHMTIVKDEARIWRFFDSFENQEALDRFNTNMIKYLKKCRIGRIQYHYGNGDIIQTTNIDNYIAEFLDTNDVNELIMKLGSIEEENLGDIKIETKLLIRSARQKVTASIN